MNLVKSNFKRIRVERTTVVIQGPIKVNDRETRWFRDDFAVWSPLDRKREIKWTKETAQTSNLKRNRVSEQSQRSAFNAFFWNDFRIDVYVYKAKNKKEKKMEIEKKKNGQNGFRPGPPNRRRFVSTDRSFGTHPLAVPIDPARISLHKIKERISLFLHSSAWKMIIGFSAVSAASPSAEILGGR